MRKARHPACQDALCCCYGYDLEHKETPRLSRQGVFVSTEVRYYCPAATLVNDALILDGWGVIDVIPLFLTYE